MAITIDQRDKVIEVVIGDGDENLMPFEDLKDLSTVLRDPPAEAHLLRLRARGDNFCLGRAPFPQSADAIRASTRVLVESLESLPASDLVIVAEVQGPAWGFGMGLVALSDVAISSPTAAYRFPEAAEGFAPAIVLAWLPMVVGERAAFDLAARARPFDAREALRLGLVTALASSPEALTGEVDAYIEELTRFPARVHRDIKGFLRSTRDITRSQAFELAGDRLALGAVRRLMEDQA